MLAKTIFAFASLMASVSAILITSPAKDDKLDFSKQIEVVWTSVSTDPSTFTLQLVDQSKVNSPIPISDNVKTSDNKYTLTNFVATPGAKYKFNFISNDPLNKGILAQSETFEISKSGSPSTSSDSSTSSTTTDSSSPTGAGAGSNASTTSSTTLSTKTTAAAPTNTSASATANASSTGVATTKGNNAVTLDRTVGVLGGLLAGLYMLLA